MSIGKSSLFLLPEVTANRPGRQRSEGDLNSMYRAISIGITVNRPCISHVANDLPVSPNSLQEDGRHA
jgi:hypothetical protein